METRFEFPPNPTGVDHTKLRLSPEYPRPGKVNRLSKAPSRTYEQPLLPNQTTVTGEGEATMMLDQISNSDLRSL